MTESIAQLPRLAAAGVLAGLAAWGLRCLWTAQAGHAHLWLKLGEVFLPMTAATAIYFLLTLWWKIPSAHDIAGFVLARAKAVTIGFKTNPVGRDSVEP
jgi:hypothetical protein